MKVMNLKKSTNNTNVYLDQKEEKGVRNEDLFNHTIAKAKFIDIEHKMSFEEITHVAALQLAEDLEYDSESLEKMFLDGTLIRATPVTHGAVLPHVRLRGIEHSQLIVIRNNTGVHIEVDHFLSNKDVKQKPIFAFFYLVSPEGNPRKHLRILAQIASHVDSDMFIQKWKKANNEQEIKELLLRDDRYLSVELNKFSKSESLINCKIKDLDLPENTLVVIIHRDGQIIVPRGRTILEENDRLTIIGDPRSIKELHKKYVLTYGKVHISPTNNIRR